MLELGRSTGVKTHFINGSFISEYCCVMLTFASGCRLLTVGSPVMSAGGIVRLTQE